jgi:hypothetical protein
VPILRAGARHCVHYVRRLIARLDHQLDSNRLDSTGGEHSDCRALYAHGYSRDERAQSRSRGNVSITAR